MSAFIISRIFEVLDSPSQVIPPLSLTCHIKSTLVSEFLTSTVTLTEESLLSTMYTSDGSTIIFTSDPKSR